MSIHDFFKEILNRNYISEIEKAKEEETYPRDYYVYNKYVGTAWKHEGDIDHIYVDPEVEKVLGPFPYKWVDSAEIKAEIKYMAPIVPKIRVVEKDMSPKKVTIKNFISALKGHPNGGDILALVSYTHSFWISEMRHYVVLNDGKIDFYLQICEYSTYDYDGKEAKKLKDLTKNYQQLIGKEIEFEYEKAFLFKTEAGYFLNHRSPQNFEEKVISLLNLPPEPSPQDNIYGKRNLSKSSRRNSK